ncbi:unnamed protein product, partial [Laminaria digitata]
FQQGRYDEAVPLLRRSLDIREKALGPEHLEVASALNGLGLGIYPGAELLSRRTLTIREKASGPEHVGVAS